MSGMFCVYRYEKCINYMLLRVAKKHGSKLKYSLSIRCPREVIWRDVSNWGNVDWIMGATGVELIGIDKRRIISGTKSAVNTLVSPLHYATTSEPFPKLIELSLRLFPHHPNLNFSFEKIFYPCHNAMKCCMLNTPTIVNRLALHTLHRNSTHLAVRTRLTTIKIRGGFRGGGVRSRPLSGIRPPADPKGPPLILFQKSIFGRPTLKFF